MTTYVAQGVAYFLTHPRLWLKALCPLLLTLVVAVASVVVVFSAAFAPQAHALHDAGVPSALAWILSLLLVVIEIFLVTFIYSLVVLPCYQDEVFEMVLINRGLGDLVHQDQRHSSCARVCAAMCRVSVLCRLLLLIVSLPLNLLPVVGTWIYVWLNGLLLAWEYHLYYFELKGLRYADQKTVIDARKAQYSSFGMQALFLEMIPGVGPFFLFTNTVGAALFAVELERDGVVDKCVTTENGTAQAQHEGYHVV
ncbi:hypothetical protein P43SY_006404 [Pythium insidiosum]|uniref:Uncharacterized protein n=1 Tax=Pythium insidiosum TaxID=114742 RepID=A0AAD5LEJ5_PYTIN|nr:hypothetical protein P43SY_006404 [Pythium insidiosum]